MPSQPRLIAKKRCYTIPRRPLGFDPEWESQAVVRALSEATPAAQGPSHDPPMVPVTVYAAYNKMRLVQSIFPAKVGGQVEHSTSG